jgi:uncharacterized protein (TIGR03067 family)
MQDDVRRIQGLWRQVAFEKDGVRDHPDERGWEPRTVFSGDAFVVTLTDGSVPIKGTFRLDPTQTPAVVEFTDTFGEDAGKMFRGIYSLEGNRLAFCVADAGEATPTEFQTGPGQVLRVFVRETA